MASATLVKPAMLAKRASDENEASLTLIMVPLPKEIDSGPLFHGARTGQEKESLRVTPTGHIAATAHLHELGAALTHPFITTDYSEAFREFITPPFTDVRDTLAFLESIHETERD